LAIEAAYCLNKNFQISDQVIQQGINDAQPRAVLQKIGDSPLTILDGGHNLQAATSLAEFVCHHTPQPRVLVIGMMKDKDISSVSRKLGPVFDQVHLTRIDSPRAASLQELRELFPSGIPYENPWDAFISARRAACTLIVAGSIYLVGEILKKLEQYPG
jgi:dihydrofolate synthase/folylpolyglutamate synthase